MKLICGLGNPGRRYEKTRHSAGFVVADRIAGGGNASFRQLEDAEAAVVSEELILLKPLLFMNLSGKPIKRFIDRKGVKMEDLLIIHDDIDLELGRVKMKSGGGDGGHRGLRSIIAETGSRDFSRVRIGVGRPEGDAVEHVLSRFGRDETPVFEEAIDAAVKAVDIWLAEGIQRAMNVINKRK
ncbi:MAG: aminoacyl-tRNA hydrolase [Deltaproteobacteria bacterium]|nr:aminoacyl-tRNA hydrolase [Deltaproteobacteria bacterium]